MKNDKKQDGEPINTEAFILFCRRVGLNYDDLDEMTIGMCIDYIEEFVEMNKPEKEKSRKATQTDMDFF